MNNKYKAVYDANNYKMGIRPDKKPFYHYKQLIGIKFGKASISGIKFEVDKKLQILEKERTLEFQKAAPMAIYHESGDTFKATKTMPTPRNVALKPTILVKARLNLCFLGQSKVKKLSYLASILWASWTI